MATVTVLVIILTAIIAAVLKLSKDRSKGKCSGCPYSGNCQKHSCSEK